MRVCLSALVISLSLFCVPIAAQTVTVTVVQNEKAPAIAIEMSRVVEDELFSVLFDSGCIASNTSVRFDGSRFDEDNFGIKEAAFGMSDYLVAVLLRYGETEMSDIESKQTWAELRSMTWRVFDVRTGALLGEQNIDITRIKISDSDPYSRARFVAHDSASSVIAAFRAPSQGEIHK